MNKKILTVQLILLIILAFLSLEEINATDHEIYLNGFYHEHGKYSENYQGDWVNLKNGKELAEKNLSQVSFENVTGEDVIESYHYKDQAEVVIKDIALKVNWNSDNHKYNTSLIYIKNCEKVIIDNILIVQNDPNYRAYHTIILEDCDTVIIKNSYFAGSVSSYHIRIAGSENIYIENNEIEGIDYDGEGTRCGGGIFIDNDDGKDLPNRTYPPYNPESSLKLKWCIIQNNYIHDNINYTGDWKNHDGILIHSPADGIIFNNYFKNWTHGDGAVDVGHRSAKDEYKNKIYRVERNIFDNGKYAKIVGYRNTINDTNNVILFANNIFINTRLMDYHYNWDAYFAHNTFIFDLSNAETIPYSLITLPQTENGYGRSFLINSLVYAPEGFNKMVFHKNQNVINSYDEFYFDYMVYLMPAPVDWLYGDQRIWGEDAPRLTTWQDWQTAGNDLNSKLISTPTSPFNDYSKEDYHLLNSSPATFFSNTDYVNHDNIALRINRDFSGRQRPDYPSAGAFEPKDLKNSKTTLPAIIWFLMKTNRP